MNRPATRQLLVRHYEANYSQDRTDFQTTMNTIGYPNKLRKIAIACGSIFGTNQDNFANGQQILEREWSPSLCSFVKFIQGNCYSTGNGYLFNGRAFKTGALACFSLGLVGCAVCVSPGLIDKSTLLQSIYIPKWDNAPGGNRNSAKFIEQTYNDAVANYGGALGGSCSANPTGKPSQPLECFIPTISSLGVNTSNLNYNADILLPKNSPNSIYPFEAYYASPINQPHVYLEEHKRRGYQFEFSMEFTKNIR